MIQKNAMKKPETPPSLPVALPLGTRESRKPEESVCRLEKKTCNVFGSLCARISNRVQKCASPVSNRLIYCGRFSESSFSLAISPVPVASSRTFFLPYHRAQQLVQPLVSRCILAHEAVVPPGVFIPEILTASHDFALTTRC